MELDPPASGGVRRRHFDYLLAGGTVNGLVHDSACHDSADRPSNRSFSLARIATDRYDSASQHDVNYIAPALLRGISAILRKTVRESDMLARCGSQDFVVLIADADERVGRCVADRLRSAIETHALPEDVTVSIGVATMTAEVADRRQLMVEADHALSYARQLGPNQVAHYTDIVY